MYMIVKLLIGVGIIICSTRIGIIYSKKYLYRLNELDEFKNNFKIIENKIKYTYEPLDQIFIQISEISDYQMSNIYKNVADNIKKEGAENAWKNEIESSKLCLKKEDKDVLKEFSVLLGKTNKEGQINQIKFVNSLLDRQIEKAKSDKEKNEILVKKLGAILGIVLFIVLI